VTDKKNKKTDKQKRQTWPRSSAGLGM